MEEILYTGPENFKQTLKTYLFIEYLILIFRK